MSFLKMCIVMETGQTGELIIRQGNLGPNTEDPTLREQVEGSLVKGLEEQLKP